MKSSHVLNSLFVLLICLPLAVMVVGIGQNYSRTGEKRELAVFPEFEWNLPALTAFPKEVKEYFADNFGLRYELIQLHNAWHVHVLNTSPNTKVVLGKEGWLFLRSAIDSQNKKLLADDEVANWVEVMEKRSRWVESQGAHFLFVVVPNKATVYPEYVPGNLKLQDLSTTDQVIQALNRQSDVNVLDLREYLVGKKSEGLLYDLTDTHWNDRGAFLAASEIVRQLRTTFSEIAPLNSSECEFFASERASGELAELLLLNDEFQEDAIRCRMRGPLLWQGIPSPKRDYDRHPDRMVSTVNSRLEFPKVLMLRDSFTTRMVPFLSSVFSEVHYVWETDQLDVGRIESNQPDIVILAVVERFLPRIPELAKLIRDHTSKNVTH